MCPIYHDRSAYVTVRCTWQFKIMLLYCTYFFSKHIERAELLYHIVHRFVHRTASFDVGNRLNVAARSFFRSLSLAFAVRKTPPDGSDKCRRKNIGVTRV